MKMSRTTRMVRSGSPWRSTGAPPLPPSSRRLLLGSPPRPRRRSTSARSSSSVAPSAAVRTMTPGPRGRPPEDRLEARALGVGQLAADAGHGALGHVHQVPAGQRDLAREPGALVADRVLGDLDQHGVARLQRVLDPARLALEAGGVPVDLARVQHGVAALADVDERGLHGGQHVLDPAEVHVAGHRRLRLLRDVVLHEHAVLEHADLRAAALPRTTMTARRTRGGRGTRPR